MLNGLAIIFVILWLAGVTTGHTVWGAIHGLLVIAVSVFIMEIHSWWLGRRLSKRPLTSPTTRPQPQEESRA